jgi:hypothetical protein
VSLRFLPPALALLLLLAAPAAARAEQVTMQEGIVGHAGLADIQDSPGAICTFSLPGPGSIGETLVKVNPPVVFAADLTPDVDRQPVGWQPRIFAFDPVRDRWVLTAEGPIYRDDSSDQTATYFGGESWTHAFLLTGGHYTVSVEMLWFDPAQPERVTGRIEAKVERYAVLLRRGDRTTQAGVHNHCRAPERVVPASTGPRA